MTVSLPLSSLSSCVLPPCTAPCTAGDAGDRELAFGNIELIPDKGEEKQNVGEMVVARGFAQVNVGRCNPLICVED